MFNPPSGLVGTTSPSTIHQHPPSIHPKNLPHSISSHLIWASVAMDIDLKPVPEFLTHQRDNVAPPSLQPLFLDFEDYWERKLWHQLTESLLKFFEHPDSAPQRILIYKNFVLTFSDKINQLKLVTLGLSASRQCKGPLNRSGHPSRWRHRLMIGGVKRV